jgi:predicted nucleic acid-binding protein
MTAYVVDASTAVKLYLNEPLAAEAVALFALLSADPPSDFHVPDLFYVECANIFWKQVRKGTLTAAEAAQYDVRVRGLPLFRTPTFELTAAAIPIGTTYDVTAYDACYVALAQRLGIPLVTADQKLHAKLAGTPLEPVWLGAWTPPGP